MVGRTFAGGTEEEQLAWSAYQRAAIAARGLVIGHGEVPIHSAFDAWQALRMPAKFSVAGTKGLWTIDINMRGSMAPLTPDFLSK